MRLLAQQDQPALALYRPRAASRQKETTSSSHLFACPELLFVEVNPHHCIEKTPISPKSAPVYDISELKTLSASHESEKRSLLQPSSAWNMRPFSVRAYQCSQGPVFERQTLSQARIRILISYILPPLLVTLLMPFILAYGGRRLNHASEGWPWSRKQKTCISTNQQVGCTVIHAAQRSKRT